MPGEANNEPSQAATCSSMTRTSPCKRRAVLATARVINAQNQNPGPMLDAVRVQAAMSQLQLARPSNNCSR